MPTTDWTSTRTQLDEIDAILKRMLNMAEPVPVPATGPSGFSASSVPVPTPAPVEHVPSWVSGIAPSVPSPYPAPLPYTPQPNPQPSNPFLQPQPVPMPYAPAPQVAPYSGYVGQPLPTLPPTQAWADPVQQPQPPTAAIVYESTPQYAEAVSTETTVQPLFSQPKTPDRPPTPTWLMPIVIVNKIFDVLFFLMGPFGAGLRTPSGKNFLGWLGLLMLLGSIGWVVGEWYGIKWPW